MRTIWLGLAFCVAATAASADYHTRRDALRKALPGGVIALIGRVEQTGEVFRFYQEQNFYYLTGWKQPGAWHQVEIKRGEQLGRSRVWCHALAALRLEPFHTFHETL